MITTEYVSTMAKYNYWQNTSHYTAASKLNEEMRREDLGAFFGSIHATLSHLLWGDQIWMNRFAGTPKPEAGSIGQSVYEVAEWDDLRQKRFAFDQEIISWSEKVTQDFLDGELSWFSGALKKDITKPTAFLVLHMFNHQTHHRGQVHAMLTRQGCRLDDTDVFAMPERF
ncbi:MAG: DinB family protein [Pseudomonadota bacterium]